MNAKIETVVINLPY